MKAASNGRQFNKFDIRYNDLLFINREINLCQTLIHIKLAKYVELLNEVTHVKDFVVIHAIRYIREKLKLING